LKEELDQLNKERTDFLSRRARFEFDIKDHEEEVRQSKITTELGQQELTRLQKLIEASETELAHISPEYERLKAAESEMIHERDSNEQKRNEIYAKQGRSTRFRNKEERDQWIKKELKILVKASEEKRAMISKLEEELEADKSRANTFKQDIGDLRARADEQNSVVEQLERDKFDFIRKKDELQIKRNDLWRDEIKLTQELNNMKDELAKTEQMLRSVTGRTILQGNSHLIGSF
jgi:structural maintenance of chromosome 3 (chondroitin sulfate proteoglycan 6)